MKYENKEIKLDQLVGYLKDKKINLSPIFQRNRVWSLPSRRALIKNILRHRPIPAIFIYKDETQSDYRFEYSILDGKQRLESIMMFIGEDNPLMKIPTVKQYIFDRDHRKNIGFSVDLGDGKEIKFKHLREELKKLGEYPIATIEVTIDEASQLDDVISLFVDINQQGQKVTRLDIVKAMKRGDPFLKELFSLVATRQERDQDIYIKKKGSNFTRVLSRLQAVSRIKEKSTRADRMWQILVELGLFVRDGFIHRKPAEILSTFIKTSKKPEARLTKDQFAKLSSLFSFLVWAYKQTKLPGTRLATDHTHFYTMTTTCLSTKLIEPGFDKKALADKLVSFGQLIESGTGDPKVKQYLELSAKQTTDTEKRKERQRLFLEIIATL